MIKIKKQNKKTRMVSIIMANCQLYIQAKLIFYSNISQRRREQLSRTTGQQYERERVLLNKESTLPF